MIKPRRIRLLQRKIDAALAEMHRFWTTGPGAELLDECGLRRDELAREARLITDYHGNIESEWMPIVAFVRARTGRTPEHIPVGHVRRRRLWTDHRCASCEHCREPWPCTSIRAQATRFADHEDFRDHWRVIICARPT